MSKKRFEIRNLGALLVGLAAAAMIIYVADQTLGLDLGWKLYLLRLKVFGQPMDGLGVRDARLGWRPKANSSGTIVRPDFTATYTFGPDGYRIVPGSPTNGPTVAMVGCSFTIGTGVNDVEAFPSVLQNEYWKTCRVRNMGVYGYGTAHVLLQLEEEFKAGHKVDLAIYGWIAHHPCRNYLRRRWLLSLTAWGGENPHFELENGKLVYKGLVGLDHAISDDDPTLGQREWRLTEALISRISALCREHGTRFLVVLLPWGRSPEVAEINREFTSMCRSLGIAYLDLSTRASLTSPSNFYRHDGHPMAAWHRSVARLIAEGIDPQTGQLRTTTSR